MHPASPISPLGHPCSYTDCHAAAGKQGQAAGSERVAVWGAGAGGRAGGAAAPCWRTVNKAPWPQGISNRLKKVIHHAITGHKGPSLLEHAVLARGPLTVGMGLWGIDSSIGRHGEAKGALLRKRTGDAQPGAPHSGQGPPWTRPPGEVHQLPPLPIY